MTPTAYRQGIMQQFNANMQALGAIRQGQVGAPEDMLSRAIVLQQLSRTLSNAFPAGSIGEGSRALPAIWENAAEFQARVEAIQQAGNALVDAARGGDAAAVQEAQGAFQQTCGACHMQFRGPAPGN